MIIVHGDAMKERNKMDVTSLVVQWCRLHTSAASLIPDRGTTICKLHACVLSHFIRIPFFVTLWTEAHQAPLYIKWKSISRVWLFAAPMDYAAAKLFQSCPTLCNPIDGSPPGSPVPGILQARTLEWVAISFSNAWKWSCSAVSDS